MKRLSVILASIVLVVGISKAVLAQSDNGTASHTIGITVPSIALLDIEGGSNITLTVSTLGLEAGNAVDFGTASNSDLWLNYTVISGKKNREISAQLENENLPSGVSLMLKVDEENNGTGDLGEIVSADAAALESNKALSIINGIGSCYTGNGTGNGHRLTYSLNMSDDGYETLVSGTETDYSTTVVYTITEY